MYVKMFNILDGYKNIERDHTVDGFFITYGVILSIVNLDRAISTRFSLFFPNPNYTV